MSYVQVIQTGTTLVSPAVPDRRTRKWDKAYTGLFQRRSTRIEVPVKAFLVETAGRLTLVDAGWSIQAATHPLKHMGFGLWFASEPVLKEEEAVSRQLEKLGIAPEDLDAIVFTHLDCDHVSGIDTLRTARRILVSPQEYAASQRKDVRYRPSFWDGVTFEELDFVFDDRSPFQQSCDIYGDGSVVAHFTPGHSKGSVALVATDVETGRFVVLAGDDGYSEKSWDELALPGPMVDASEMTRTLKWVRELRSDERCAGVFAAHDPAVAPGVYEF